MGKHMKIDRPKLHRNCYACNARDYNAACTCAAEWRKEMCACGHAAGSHDYGLHVCNACAGKAQRVGTAEAVNAACYRFVRSAEAAE
jgi:hypothetical protein